jgi:phosphatidylserine decarboxylase
MKHAGKAAKAARRLIGIALVIFLAVSALWLCLGHSSIRSLSVVFGIFAVIASLAVLFILFTLYFFRDPEAVVPAGAGLVVSPGHGLVDAIDTIAETEFMGGECRRISMFLSVIDVHVQNTPVAGRVMVCKHTPGQYLSALKSESAKFNENVLIGFESADPRGEKIGVRLIAGLIARRIIPWASVGETVARGERMSLIQFGSRVDVYLPMRANIKVRLGDRVVGGESVLAAFN